MQKQVVAAQQVTSRTWGDPTRVKLKLEPEGSENWSGSGVEKNDPDRGFPARLIDSDSRLGSRTEVTVGPACDDKTG